MILNLTQHKATPEQLSEGVHEPREEVKQRIRELLTFEDLPTVKDIERRADELADLACREIMKETGRSTCRGGKVMSSIPDG